ncbi:hypothetical protein D3C73_1094640 [compost metagenome]
MIPHALHIVDPGAGDLRGFQSGHHFVDAQLRKPVNDDLAQRFAVGRTFEVRREAFIRRQCCIQQHFFAEQRPLTLVLQPKHHGIAAFGREGAVRVNRRMGSACTRRRRRALEPVVHRVTHPLHQALEHAHINATANPGFIAQHQRGQNSGVGVHACSDISDGATSLSHLIFTRPACHREKPALALNQQVIGFFLLIGAAFSIT